MLYQFVVKTIERKYAERTSINLYWMVVEPCINYSIPENLWIRLGTITGFIHQTCEICAKFLSAELSTSRYIMASNH